jgi:hypothetical protein
MGITMATDESSRYSRIIKPVGEIAAACHDSDGLAARTPSVED